MPSPETAKIGRNRPPDDFPDRRRAFFAWALLLAYAAFIDLTLSAMPAWREALIERFGEGVFAIMTYGAAVILLLVILGVMIWRRREKNPLAYLSLVGILLFLRHVMRHWIVIPVEQIHFIEYGIMGFLAYNALKHHLRGWGLVLAALALTYLFGMIDECLQGNLANRVGEQRDMYWNGLAGVLGLAVVVLALKPRWIRGPSGRREMAVLLMFVGLSLPLQGYFNSAIAQFGILIHDSELQVQFRSRMAPQRLPSYGENIEQFKADIVPKIGKAKMHEIMPLVYNRIHEEALVHIFRCGRYMLENKPFVALKEYWIIDKYYASFIRGTWLEQTPEKIAQLTEAVGDSTQVLYASPVAQHLITKFSAAQMWGTIGIIEAGILVVLLRPFNRRGRRGGAAGAV